MPDPYPPAHRAELIELANGMRELLSASDRLGLEFVGVHLCEALEALQDEVGPSIHFGSIEGPPH